MGKKVILITGGSSGLGAETIKKLSACEDTSIYYTYHATENAAEPLCGKIIPIHCDLGKEEEILACVSRIATEEGKIDVLVNNACSSFRPCELLTADWGMFQDIIDVNVKGAFIFTREVSKIMKVSGGGKIINILSSYVLNVPPGKISFYITAKYALMGFSKAAAVELCKYGITVNMISPGLMDTPLSGYLPNKYLQVYRQKHPMKRMTETSDVAGVLEFLISDGSNFINGANIPVNGGEAF